MRKRKEVCKNGLQELPEGVTWPYSVRRCNRSMRVNGSVSSCANKQTVDYSTAKGFFFIPLAKLFVVTKGKMTRSIRPSQGRHVVGW